ncbi:protein OXIDATIVE STRESS 3 LIKE 4-like [Magnolia sinica]|uniref:protein OXIDATIVE STRESS 3 LIKE 4-like n=1 Tax=Magnolia sinica TaxID=86752 RepID=UPI0026597C00|nr:protein OXIDATIVE STRESS 3 LIKE 4-like [Magnolia sinica]
MSLVYGTREVSVGPTVGYQGDAPPQAYVSKSQVGELLQTGEGKRGGVEAAAERRNGFRLDGGDSTPSGESSSIGCDSSVEDEKRRGGSDGEEDEVQSKFNGGLGSMGLLEESLPIKRGLSNFFRGKSKSFASLSNITSVEDMAKPENPFNKRRRTLLACKTAWSKRAFYSPLNTSLPALTPPDRTLEGSESESEEEEEKEESPIPPLPIKGRKFKSFRSPRSFSLTDLRDA